MAGIAVDYLLVWFECLGTRSGSITALATGRDRPILLKKSAMVSTAEKYALEIEICTLSKGLRAQISRSCAKKRRF